MKQIGLEVTPEAEKELETLVGCFWNAVHSAAVLIAVKKKHEQVLKEDIVRAAARIRVLEDIRVTWALRISLAILTILISLQMSALISPEIQTLNLGFQMRLWMLPVFMIAWVIVLSYILKEFLL